MLEKRFSAIVDLSQKMERLSQFQDRIDIPSNVHEIWNIFLDDVRNLIKLDACALFLVDEDSHEFVLRGVLPRDKGLMCENEIEFQIENGMFAWIIHRREPAIIPSVVFKNRKTIIMLPLSTVRRTLGGGPGPYAHRTGFHNTRETKTTWDVGQAVLSGNGKYHFI